MCYNLLRRDVNMSCFYNVYKNLLMKYPLGMQALQAGTLMAVGDQLAQNYIEQRKRKDLDFLRTAQFFGIGFCIGGPATRTWYGILDKYIGSKGAIVTIKKVAADQILFAPTFIAVLLTSVGILQGNNFRNIKNKLNNEYLDILYNNYKIWPVVQLVNFAFVPLNYQVLVVQSVAVLWNCYISYRTNRDPVKQTHVA